MSLNTIEEVGQELIKSSCQIYVAATGAGAGLQNMIWKTPGISKVFVGASFPYAQEATDDFLGYKSEKYCTSEMAVAMAQESFMRAFANCKGSPVGLGLTASVSSDRVHRGDHRIHVAVLTEHGLRTASATLFKHASDSSMARALDGVVSDNLALQALMQSLGHELSHEFSVNADDFISYEQNLDADPWPVFWKNPFFHANGSRSSGEEVNERTIYPGAFNPPHFGHFAIKNAVNPRSTVFSITVDHPIKPKLSIADVLKRAVFLKGEARLFSQGDSTYIEKAERHPKSDFIIGADALLRIYDPKWCPDRFALTKRFVATGCLFHVVPRKVEDKLVTLDGLIQSGKVHPEFPAKHVSGQWDISSSEIRAKAESTISATV